MKIHDTECPGVKLIECFCAEDMRGKFVKTFNYQDYKSAGLDVDIKEAYYSQSCRGVIRGMHFQLPPYDHAKIVHVINGEVNDVILDLRQGSPTYKKTFSFILSGGNHRAIYIPKGLAHGFKCLCDNTVMLYQVTSGYEKTSDMGILYSSIDFDWEDKNAIVSERDKSFIELDKFVTPFIWEE